MFASKVAGAPPPPRVSLRDITIEYRWLVSAVLAITLVSIAAIFYVLRLHLNQRRLSRSLEKQLAETKKAEEALAASEAFYHSLVEHLPQLIIRKDLEGRFMFGNRRFCAEIGKTQEQIRGMTDFDLFPRDLAEKYRADDQRVITTGQLFETVEEHVTGEGKQLYVQVIKTPVRDAAGRVIGTQGIFWDVTEHRRAEEALRASREQFDLAVRGSNDGLWDWDVRTNVTYFSPQWKGMLGYDDPEIPNRFEEWESLLHPEDRDRALATVKAYFENRLPVYALEHRLRHKDGTYRWILARGVALRDAEGRVYRMAGSHTDITARKEAQRQLQEQNEKLEEAARSEHEARMALMQAQGTLVQTEKLAALGQMVAGVAHEINNPLAFVSNNAAVMQRDVNAMSQLLTLYSKTMPIVAEHDPELATQLKELSERYDAAYTLPNLQDLLVRSRDGLKRIQQIVHDLRDFARLDSSDMHEVDLNSGIESTVNIIRGLAKRKHVTVEMQLGKVPLVTCYAAKINQVVMNLIANAIDACDDEGKVSVTTRRSEDGIEIEVIDTGCGIPTAIREKIFDPFFTTKPPGEGTGLGLSISYGIVKDHGGSIEVQSEVGKGTAFTIKLPRGEKSREPSAVQANG